MTAKFPLGQLVATPGALQAMGKAGQPPIIFLSRHQCGDWGEVCLADAKMNDQALQEGGRLLSSYRTLKGEVLWVITEYDRSLTTILLPQEY
jgi:hypothetical protein